MKPDTFMPLFVADYMADTAHLSRDEDGGYLRLLMAYWRKGGPLVADDTALARIAKATPAEWRRLRPVLSQFFEERDGHWHNKRSDAELADAVERMRSKSEAGAKGAAARWQAHSKRNGNSIADALPTQWPPPPPSPSQKIPSATHSAGSPSDLWKQVWEQGRAYLVSQGQTEGDARKALMRWRQNHHETDILRALKVAETNAVELPIPYVETLLKGKPNARQSRDSTDGPLHRLARLATEAAGEDVRQARSD